MIYSEQEIEAANSRASALLARTPTAVAAHYDQRLNRVFIDLSSGVSIAFKAGSSSKSIAKTAAVRANGKLGGLPKKIHEDRLEAESLESGDAGALAF